MAVRLDPSRWLAPLGVTLLAIPLGLLAGIDPRFAIFVALGCGFVLLAFTNLAAGLAVFAFLGFVQVVPVGDLAKLIGLLLALAWFALITTRPRAELEFLTVHPLMSVVTGLFVAWALLSSTWSEVPADAVSSAGRYALDAVLFLIVFTAVRSPRHLGWVLLAFVLGAAVASIHGIVSPPASEHGRVSNEVLDPNQLGAVLVAGGPLAVAIVALYRKVPPLRLLGGLTAVFTLVALWLTASRGAMVALLVVLIAALVIGSGWRPLIALAAILIAFSTYTYYAGFASPETQDRLEAVTRGEDRLKEGRTTLWQLGWRAFERNPAEGVGAGNFPAASRHFLLEPGVIGRSDVVIGEEQQVVHNSWLEIAAEMGAIGFALFAAIVAFSLGTLLRAARRFRELGNRRLRAVAICIALALIGYIAALTFISDAYSKGLWLLLGLGPAVLAMARAQTDRSLSARSSS